MFVGVRLAISDQSLKDIQWVANVLSANDFAFNKFYLVLLASYMKALPLYFQCGYSPLHAAAYFGHLSAVQTMLEHGANPCLQDKVRIF